MTDFNPSEYGLTIRQQMIDGYPLWAGRVAEFPDVEVFEHTFESAREALLGILVSFKEAALRHGNNLPSPQIPQDVVGEYSGRVTLRLTKSLHKKVAQVAQDEGVSLNQFLLATIAEATGEKAGTPSLPMVVSHVITMQSAIATGAVRQQKFIVAGTIEESSPHSHIFN